MADYGPDLTNYNAQLAAQARKNPNDERLRQIAYASGATMPTTGPNSQDSFLSATSVPGWAIQNMSDEDKAKFQLYDKSSFDYGGSQAAGDAEAQRLATAQAAAVYRQAPQIDQTGMNSELARALAARGQQMEAAGMFQNMAAGQGPTVAPAQMSLANALATGQGAQMLAAGPRGPAGAAAVRAAALQGTGQAMGQNALGAAMARSGEQFGGMGGYQGVTNAVFGGDMRGAQTTANMAGAQAELSAQSQAQNDAMSRYYASQRAQVLGAQQQGRIAREQFQGGEVRQASALAAGLAKDAAQRSQRSRENAMSMVGSGVGAVANYASGKGK